MAQILIIEDNQDFVAFVQAVLELNGHSVAHTASLRDSLSLAHRAPYPDLVLLDLDLPDGNGLDFLEQVATDVPVLVLTASTDADLARQLQTRQVRYLIKPVAARDLLMLVQDALSKGAVDETTAHPHRG
jgi:DNA-binding response OmpR family regulator